MASLRGFIRISAGRGGSVRDIPPAHMASLRGYNSRTAWSTPDRRNRDAYPASRFQARLRGRTSVLPRISAGPIRGRAHRLLPRGMTCGENPDAPIAQPAQSPYLSPAGCRAGEIPGALPGSQAARSSLCSGRRKPRDPFPAHRPRGAPTAPPARPGTAGSRGTPSPSPFRSTRAPPRGTSQTARPDTPPRPSSRRNTAPSHPYRRA